MNGKQITVNGVTAEIRVEEAFSYRFGHFQTKQGYKVSLVNIAGKYTETVCTYSSKALLAKHAEADAYAKLAKLFPAKPAPAPAPVAEPEEDLLAILLSFHKA